MPEQTYTRKIWIRLVKYSSAEVLDPSEVDVDVKCPVLVPYFAMSP